MYYSLLAMISKNLLTDRCMSQNHQFWTTPQNWCNPPSMHTKIPIAWYYKQFVHHTSSCYGDSFKTFLSISNRLSNQILYGFNTFCLQGRKMFPNRLNQLIPVHSLHRKRKLKYKLFVGHIRQTGTYLCKTEWIKFATGMPKIIELWTLVVFLFSYPFGVKNTYSMMSIEVFLSIGVQKLNLCMS